LQKFKNIQGELLDIGSGSGILGLLLARDYKKLRLNQCEIQPQFQYLSKINAKTNKISSIMHKCNFLDLKYDKCFDIVVSNPPFYHENVIKSQNQNIKIARYNNSLPLNDFIEKTSSILCKNGKFFFCYDVKQINDIILFLNKFELNIESMQFVYSRADKDASLILIYARKNSKSLTKILPALIVFDGDGFSKEVENIYKKSGTYSIKIDEIIE